ncbi:MAG: hypothetical protein KIT09_15905 [Bryobacteraceae bacterium]|nr:hypothetical protein [Bryobacteraceae bacterium]
MAYQIRVASDQIRFAIKSSEQFGHDQGVMTEVRMQLLDALQRLETAERHFSQALLKRTQGDGVGACGSVPEQALIK